MSVPSALSRATMAGACGAITHTHKVIFVTAQFTD
jgi:hypothetical protein